MTTGFAINTEGIFDDLPASTYHAAPGLSNSMLKNLEPTPAHLVAYLTGEREVTPAMVLGTLTHSLVLEPDKGLPRISIKPDDLRRNSKAFKAWEAEQNGNLIIGQDAFDSLLGMTASIARHPFASKALRNGRTELSLFSNKVLEDGREPVLRKMRLDFAPLTNYLCDVKTCLDASEVEFGKTMLNMGYHRQAAWYLDIWNDLHPQDQREGFLFIAVEKSAPYAVACYFLEPEAISLGRSVNEKLARVYMECRDAQKWPAYSDGWKMIDVPKWALGRNEG